MNNLDELVEMGEKIISHFDQRKENYSDISEIVLSSSESIVSVQILLDYLRKDIFEIEKIEFLANLIGEHHKLAKPFSILHWCNKIISSINEVEN